MDRGYDTRSPIQKRSSIPRTIAFFRLYTIVFFLFLLVGVFLIFAHSSVFKVDSIFVSGGTDVENQNVQAYVVKVLEGSWQTILPLNSSISLPGKTIEKKITATFPIIKNAEVKWSGVSKIDIRIDLRLPEYAFCEEDNCVLVDADGIVFALSNRLEGIEIVEGSLSDFMKRSLEVDTKKLELGKPFLDEVNLSSLHKTSTLLKSQNFEIKHVRLFPLGFFDVQAVELSSKKEVEFRFRDNPKVDQQLQELKLAFDKGLLEKVKSEHVQYVISYIPQKVIYRNIKE